MAKRRNQTRGRRPSKMQRKARRQQWIIGGIVAILVVATVGVVYAYLTEDKPGEVFDDMGNSHLSEAPAAFIWNSRPPTSGPHAPNIAAWGVHDEPVPDWIQVHNLEDGGVIMHYNCPDGCPDIVTELEDIVDDKGEEQLILQPYENMDTTIALTAWTRRLQLDSVDRDQIESFIDAYRGIDHHR